MSLIEHILMGVGYLCLFIVVLFMIKEIKDAGDDL